VLLAVLKLCKHYDLYTSSLDGFGGRAHAHRLSGSRFQSSQFSRRIVHGGDHWVCQYSHSAFAAFSYFSAQYFTFVVDGIVLKLCAALLPGFRIESWSAAIFGAFVLALVGTGLHYVLI
jgi:hypothetical protein